MPCKNLSKWLAWSAALLCGAAAQAVTVDSLPYPGTPDWTDVVFSGTSMTSTGGTTVLSTANIRGVWFGWMSGLSGNTPSWAPGASSDGNHLSLTLSFSAAAADWSAYLYDGSHEAAFGFRPSGCIAPYNNCYALTGQAGVALLHGDAADAAVARSLFVPMATLDQPHQFEYLMKNGQVAYRIDGQVVYAGPAFQAGGNRLLVIGDGSGSTGTGKGSMTVHAVRLDTAPLAGTLVSTVPEPATWGLMLAGVAGLLAWTRRRA